jgi:hypothetical protein
MKIAKWFKKRNQDIERKALIEELKICKQQLIEQNKELDELRRRIFELEDEKADLMRAVKTKMQHLTIFKSNRKDSDNE